MNISAHRAGLLRYVADSPRRTSGREVANRSASGAARGAKGAAAGLVPSAHCAQDEARVDRVCKLSNNEYNLGNGKNGLPFKSVE